MVIKFASSDAARGDFFRVSAHALVWPETGNPIHHVDAAGLGALASSAMMFAASHTIPAAKPASTSLK